MSNSEVSYRRPRYVDLAIPYMRQVLERHLDHMVRSRAWTDQDNNSGARYILGERNAILIEEALGQGKTVMEIGSGDMRASDELAQFYPQGNLVVVEPYPPVYVPLPNVQVLVKPAEKLTAADLNQVAIVFGVWVFDYLVDKLEILLQIFNALAPNAIIILYVNSIHSTYPSLHRVFKALDPRVEVVRLNMFRSPQGKILQLTKLQDQALNNKAFELVSLESHGGAMVKSIYHKKPQR